jgi:Na+-transporting NADH:ubiquinone oxidoreductase subunit A
MGPKAHALVLSPKRTPSRKTAPAVPKTTMHAIQKGLDLPIAGRPEPVVREGPAITRVAVLGADFHGLRPGDIAAVGSRVRRGEALFEDKKRPGIRHTAPAAGTVLAVNRGDKRAFASLVIAVDESGGADDHATFASYTGAKADALGTEGLRALLRESGLWTAFRTRPWSRVPEAAAVASAIFVTAMDTRPLAAPMGLRLAGREDDFARGVLALREITPGSVFVCRGPGDAITIPAADRVVEEIFTGPHPAGLAGTHIHFLHPVGHDRAVWHVGAEDVAAIGQLLASGKLDTTRVVSIGGPGVATPVIARTRLAASTAELLAGRLAPGEQRIVSGSVLDGRSAAGEALGYLGRYHGQVSVLPEGRDRELFGWIAPGTQKHSVKRAVLGALGSAAKALTTTTNGSLRAHVPIGSQEAVMPLDILPTFLCRALLSGDIERAEALGALELDEEDLALCTYACPGKNDYGPMLRDALARLEKES